MIIEILDGKWAITVPAKVNLFLEVLGKRTDGYHSLDTIMTSVSLTDQLIFSPRPDDQIVLTVEKRDNGNFRKLSSTDSAWDIPEDARNLVVKALLALRAKIEIARGMDVVLRKSIPAQAGLGGGSADAAASLVGGMLAWSWEYDHSMASELASTLGSDVNFFLDTAYSGFFSARCTGRGELVDTIHDFNPLNLLIVHPTQGCSTKAIFDQLDKQNFEELPRRDNFDILQALQSMDGNQLGANLWNRLSDPAMSLNPWLEQIQSIFRTAAGVLGYSLSGSGSAMFAIMESSDAAARLEFELKEKNLWRVYNVSSWQSVKILDQLEKLQMM